MAIEIETSELPFVAKNIYKNKELSGGLVTAPDFYHYPHGYFWDSAFHTIIYARSGVPELAQEEIEAVFSWQDKKTGFIANTKFHPTKGTRHLERRFVFGKNSETSKYSQPPVIAQSYWETYESYIKQGKEAEAEEYVNKNYDSLSSYFKYLIRERENNGSLIKIIHPHETGRDFDPTYDFTNPFIMKRSDKPIIKTFIDKSNLATNQASRFLWAINWAKRHNFDPNMLNVNDTMFNAIYADGLSYMSRVAQVTSSTQDAEFFAEKANAVGSDIIDKMWDENSKNFYSLRNGEFIKAQSINNLAGLMVPQIKPNQLERMLDLLEDPNEFGTPNPIPSVPVSSPYFDPDFKEWGIWRGGTWMFTNFLLEQGLRERALQFRFLAPKLSERATKQAQVIRSMSLDMVTKHGEAEFYHPLTSARQRKEVKSFGPSNLAYVMEIGEEVQLGGK